MTYPQDPNNPYGQQQYGYQQPGYPQYPGYPGYAGGLQQPQEGSGLAVGSLVCSILGLVLCFAVGIAGIIMGHIAYGKAKRGVADGQGIALAGIIIGYCAVALNIGLFAFFIGIGALGAWR
ncbi:DUF4190 domain-containing protein [Amycolatopsis sp. SID8362]|uniref:DUF4190 domain-containing protein n=1 Tax=Amycolatopsis sp. SID8362 TaxID=2690346 RepID=UPI001367ABD3|nr:DUF4190 domain-containing protein [Amycolatopsis sp. SID8362]NBH09046.1 DUF4190 domain-containing protein [Amycolatopsis sp. SID8362]NED45738.1 DUF4190 domain-containing protein [Amycolatopsis sp. SID8362]